jgi:hypothetical protein
MPHTTTLELDELARLGFDALRDAMTTHGNIPPELREKAKLAIQLTAESTRRLAAETNRAAVLAKYYRETDGDLQSLRPMLQRLSGVPEGEPEK